MDTYGSTKQKKLRWGYTTGTCAAAASLAAAAMLLSGERREQVFLLTPKGIRLHLDIEEIRQKKEMVSCAVRKDGGDDPDVTDGLLVYSTVKVGDVSKNKGDFCRETGDFEYKTEAFSLILKGGVGIGRVTKPGLSCKVGEAAINPVPRRMIFEQVAAVCREKGFQGKLSIEISVPDGREAAERTFNPKLGIVGGISILGTSGIVEPMSEAALIETIRLELRQKHLSGMDRLMVTPGNYGEAFLSRHLGLDLEQAVKCSNYIGAALDMAAQEGIKEILLIGHGGKLIKIAGGIMNTHSSVADGRMEILGAHASVCGAEGPLVEQVLDAVTVDQGLALLETVPGLRERTMDRIMERIGRSLRRRAGDSLKVEALVFTNERGVLGQTPGAEEMMKGFRRRSISGSEQE
mgnify:CR=1 FL=1